MRYSRALFAAALALSAAACGQSVSAPTEPASGVVAPTGPSYDGGGGVGVGWGGGQYADTTKTTASGSSANTDPATIAVPGSVSYGGGQ